MFTTPLLNTVFGNRKVGFFLFFSVGMQERARLSVSDAGAAPPARSSDGGMGGGRPAGPFHVE